MTLASSFHSGTWIKGDIIEGQKVPVGSEPGQAGADEGVQIDSGQEWRANSAVEELYIKTNVCFH